MNQTEMSELRNLKMWLLSSSNSNSSIPAGRLKLLR